MKKYSVSDTRQIGGFIQRGLRRVGKFEAFGVQGPIPPEARRQIATAQTGQAPYGVNSIRSQRCGSVSKPPHRIALDCSGCAPLHVPRPAQLRRSTALLLLHLDNLAAALRLRDALASHCTANAHENERQPCHEYIAAFSGQSHRIYAELSGVQSVR